MSSATVQSSPTIAYAHRISLGPLPALDLVDTLLSRAMENESDQRSPDAVHGSHESADPAAEPEFFDLQPTPANPNAVRVEDVMKRLFSAEHLHWILGDHLLFHRFSAFLNRYKAHLVPTLVRYLEMRKAVKAIEYANAVARSIRWPSHTDFCKFTRVQAAQPDARFEDYASRELLLLCSEALPAFLTHNLVGVISDCVAKDLTGAGIPVLQNLIGNLAEVFCLTDPSIHDNPIIFASEEFHRTTQYGTTYAIDRNCRFLQGPGTDKDTTLRLAKAIALGQESNEILLNYRRDGTPFVNLLMCAPLYDDKGKVRYFIGAQVDVTGLVVEGLGIESFRSLLANDGVKDFEITSANGETPAKKRSWQKEKTKDTLSRLTELSLMFSQDESDVVQKNSRGGDDQSTDAGSVRSAVPTMSVKNRGQSKRIIGNDIAEDASMNFGQMSINNGTNMSLPGVYKHYLLVRPHPSLQIIFVSPSLRIPGLLRTHLFTKLGGPTQTLTALESAFRDGASVTAKVLWLPKNTHAGERGRGPGEVKPRYIRCTPLLGSDDRVGVWMVVLVPVDQETSINGLGPNGNGYGIHRGMQHISDMMSDEPMIDERWPRGSSSVAGSRSGSRAPSVRGAASFDTSQTERSTTYRLRSEKPTQIRRNGRIGRDFDDGGQLYAEYLRSSSSTGGSGASNLGEGEQRRLPQPLGPPLSYKNRPPSHLEGRFGGSLGSHPP